MAFRARGNSASVRRAREGLIDFKNSHYKYVLHALAEVARHASYVAARHTPLYSGAAALGWSLSLWPEDPTRESGSYELNYEEGSRHAEKPHRSRPNHSSTYPDT